MNAPDDRPALSLAEQATAWLRSQSRRLPSPGSYGPALATLALIPGTTALLACALASWHDHRSDAMTRKGANRIATLAAGRANAERRAAMAPLLGAPTLTAALGRVAAALPRDASFSAISRDVDGRLRVEIDCPDPDALLNAFRASAPAWHAVAQSVAAGNGVRVTLEAAER